MAVANAIQDTANQPQCVVLAVALDQVLGVSGRRSGQLFEMPESAVNSRDAALASWILDTTGGIGGGD